MTREEAIYRLKAAFTMCEFRDAYGDHIDSDIYYEALDMAIKALEQEPCEDAVPRASVEYICRKNTVSTNPYDHEYHEKFIKFMDDPEIADFGRWQLSNGFNTALVAVKCDLDKVPSVQLKLNLVNKIDRLLEEYRASQPSVIGEPITDDSGTEKKQCFDDYKNRSLIMSDEKCSDCEHKYECRFMQIEMDEVVYGSD